MKFSKFNAIFTSFCFIGSAVWAGSSEISGGLTLLETPNARPASLGEAFSAVTNDIAAFNYNPASLSTIKNGQASFLYQKGLLEDSYGQFTIGGGSEKGNGFGLSVGFYNAGDIEITDDSGTHSVSAQKDISVGVGYARKIGGSSYGVNLKVLQSKLVDQYSATAYAADFGMMMPVSNRINFGLAARNIGTELKYVEEGDSLPRIFDAGLSMNLVPGAYNTTLMLNTPYYANEKEVQPGVGLETLVGPLAIRAGYKKKSDASQFTIGAGFQLGRSNFDYSFGLVKDLSSEHKVSLSMRFGNSISQTPAFVAKPSNRTLAKLENIDRDEDFDQDEAVAQKRQVVELPIVNTKRTLGSLGKSGSVKSSARRIYMVRAGDNLSTIARKVYGDSREWKRIYAANKHLMGDNRNVEVGQKVILP